MKKSFKERHYRRMLFVVTDGELEQFNCILKEYDGVIIDKNSNILDRFSKWLIEKYFSKQYIFGMFTDRFITVKFKCYSDAIAFRNKMASALGGCYNFDLI